METIKNGSMEASFTEGSLRVSAEEEISSYRGYEGICERISERICEEFYERLFEQPFYKCTIAYSGAVTVVRVALGTTLRITSCQVTATVSASVALMVPSCHYFSRKHDS